MTDISQEFITNEPLSSHSTFHIGGAAKYFIVVKTNVALIEAIKWAKANQTKFLILGGGSNILFSDAGFDGLVIKNQANHLEVRDDTIFCEGGVNLGQILASSINRGLTGLEWMVRLPGTVGGAVRGNAGHLAVSVRDVLTEVTVYNYETDEKFILTNNECGFGYRTSRFKDEPLVVLSATFAVQLADSDNVRAKIIEDLSVLVKQQPPDPSAGCTFKNIQMADYPEFDHTVLTEAETVGAYRNGKLSTAWLIDREGFKGKKIGGARVSEMHASYIINTEKKATASDVLMLISLIKQRIRTQYGVQLLEEIIIL
ncbi:MAG: UDP-N-acetylmuramate dehydrogenase [Candidatus Falkowbacteria bacterium]